MFQTKTFLIDCLILSTFPSTDTLPPKKDHLFRTPTMPFRIDWDDHGSMWERGNFCVPGCICMVSSIPVSVWGKLHTDWLYQLYNYSLVEWLRLCM